MAANLSAHAITTSIATGQELLLYRTLDLPDDSAQRIAEIQRSIAVASAYFEDKLGSRPRTLYYAEFRTSPNSLPPSAIPISPSSNGLRAPAKAP